LCTVTTDNHTGSCARPGQGRRLNWKQIKATGANCGASLKLLLLTLPALLILPAGASSAPSAHEARSLSVTDTAHLKLVHHEGEYITEEGQATGALPGHVKLLLEVGPTVVARFTITAAGGSISGVGSGKPKGRSEEPSFAGSMKVTHGTGRYRHAHGTGGFYGTLNRGTYKMVVQTTGTLDY
jgi:hypothetical protein